MNDLPFFVYNKDFTLFDTHSTPHSYYDLPN